MSKKKTVIDPEMWGRAKCALHRTWDTIGSDAVQACIDCGESTRMTHVDVRDMVSACGFKGGYPRSYGGDNEAIDWIDTLSRKDQDKLLAEAFPKGIYN